MELVSRRTRGFEVAKGFEAYTINLPKRATSESAGYDFESAEDVTIKPLETIIVKTGVKAYMPKDEVLKLYGRSSLSIKRGLMVANSVGIIDADYYSNENNDGAIMLALYNISDKEVSIKKGERISQGIFSRYYISDTDDTLTVRVGGVGSSGQ